MSLRPTVSVAITTRNRLDYLRLALASIAEQTRPADELVVVNDGGAAVTSVLAGFPGPCTVLDSARNEGTPSGLNRAIRASTGDLIAMCDDDDLWAKTHIEALEATFRDPDVVLAYTSTLAFTTERTQPFAVMARDFDLAHLRTTNYLVASAVMFRRSVYEAVGGFDPALTGYSDWDFYLKVVTCGRVAWVEAPLTFYRVHPGSTQIALGEAARREQLTRLCERHGLGELPLKALGDNFVALSPLH